MKRFVVGDIHGAAKALEQVLERAGFDKQKDQLITLGDITDGWAYVKECVDILLTIPNRIDLEGNHDTWFKEFIRMGIHPDNFKQGGLGTLKSYGRYVEDFKYDYKMSGGYISNLNPEYIPPEHQAFFRGQHLYYVDDDNNLFVHAGFNRQLPIKGQFPSVLLWDRSFWLQALSYKQKPGMGNFKIVDNFKTVFIGHTSTTTWSDLESDTTSSGIVVSNIGAITRPLQGGGGKVWNIDTGAGGIGKLTLMDVDTHEYWQSDLVTSLYPNEKGR